MAPGALLGEHRLRAAGTLALAHAGLEPDAGAWVEAWIGISGHASGADRAQRLRRGRGTFKGVRQLLAPRSVLRPGPFRTLTTGRRPAVAGPKDRTAAPEALRHGPAACAPHRRGGGSARPGGPRRAGGCRIRGAQWHPPCNSRDRPMIRAARAGKVASGHSRNRAGTSGGRRRGMQSAAVAPASRPVCITASSS